MKNSNAEVTVRLLVNKTYSFGQPVTIEYEITNNSEKDLYVLEWSTPINEISADILIIKKQDNTVLEYDGTLHKWANPSLASFKLIHAKSSVSGAVNISKAYYIGDLGNYQIQLTTDFYLCENADDVKNANFRVIPALTEPVEFSVVNNTDISGKENLSAYLTLGMEHRLRETGTTDFIKKDMKGYVPGEAKVTPTVVNATATQKATLLQAHTNVNAPLTRCYKTLLNNNSSNSDFVKWFGAYTNSRFTKIENNFVQIDNAYRNTPLTYNGNGPQCQIDVYAYTYKGTTTIYFCGLFWKAPSSGYDSQFGTIIHELSHAICSTDDVKNTYGPSACLQLAKTNPDGACQNADNHEYFSETV